MLELQLVGRCGWRERDKLHESVHSRASSTIDLHVKQGRNRLVYGKKIALKCLVSCHNSKMNHSL